MKSALWNLPGRGIVGFGMTLLSFAAPSVHAVDDGPAIVLSQAASSPDEKAQSKESARPPGTGLRYPAGRWYFQTSAYTRHFNPSPQHTNHQRMLNFEYWGPDKWIWGVSFQRNSFNQPTEYVYMGRLWRPLDVAPIIHLKLTAGVLHGYEGEFRDKIPFNHYGYAPAIVPAIGISGKRFASEIILLGNAAFMITAGAFWE
ncbi:MAG: hypothetical protein ACKVQU_10390 [Burkholderiales bacterium]